VTLRALVRDDGGAVAIAVALLLPALIGAGALAVDVSHSRLVQNRLQSAADAAALAAVQSLDDQPVAAARAVEYVGLNLPESFGEATRAGDVTFGTYDPADRSFTPSTDDVNAIRVTAARDDDHGNAVPRFLARIFGLAPGAVSASAIAARTITTVYDAPEMRERGLEAWDYNEIFAYCFDYAGSGPAESRRSQMTLISRNVNMNPPLTYTWPTCAPGQSISFRLRNVRYTGSTSLRDRIERGGTFTGREPVHNHYTDTVLDGNREILDLAGLSLVETVRCDSEAECDKRSRGGVVPEGRNRAPNRETRPCVPGKYMYYGWEDRPPEWGSSDADFDDITFVLRCPSGRDVSFGSSRLVR